MKYTLTKPCGNCPFTKSCMPGWLGGKRAEELVDGRCGMYTVGALSSAIFVPLFCDLFQFV